MRIGYMDGCPEFLLAGPPVHHEQDDQSLASTEDDTGGLVGSSASQYVSSPPLERNQVGAITLAKFLMTVVSLHANIIRSHWESHASETFDGVPYSSTGQHPNG